MAPRTKRSKNASAKMAAQVAAGLAPWTRTAGFIANRLKLLEAELQASQTKLGSDAAASQQREQRMQAQIEELEQHSVRYRLAAAEELAGLQQLEEQQQHVEQQQQHLEEQQQQLEEQQRQVLAAASKAVYAAEQRAAMAACTVHALALQLGLLQHANAVMAEEAVALRQRAAKGDEAAAAAANQEARCLELAAQCQDLVMECHEQQASPTPLDCSVMLELMAAMKQPRRVLAEAYAVGCKMTWGPSEPQLEGQAVTEEQVDSQVRFLVRVFGGYYTMRMKFLDELPYLTAALGDSSTAARQWAARMHLRYLEREQLLGHLEGEDASKYDPLELHKMRADLEVTRDTGMLTPAMEQLLSRYYRATHMTNAVPETMLKQLNNDSVLRMNAEGMSGRAKLAMEDTTAWVADGVVTQQGMVAATAERKALQNHGASPWGTAASPGGTAASPGGTAASPGGTAASPWGTAASPGGTAASPGGTAASPGGTAASPGGTAASPGGTAASPGGTAASPGGGTQAPATNKARPGKRQQQAPSKAERVMKRIRCLVSMPSDEQRAAAVAVRDSVTARQQQQQVDSKRLKELEDTARGVYNRFEPPLPALRSKGISVEELKHLSQKFGVGSVGKNRRQLLERIAEYCKQ
ncbi:hypothetical protein QJQ45_028200 [Haematococcus lacustris]|nr:hypothetical protein QJQ45_028200 [Haematococcus lacustris]